MNTETFFKQVLDHYNAELPFVCYATPKSTTVEVLLQEDTQLHEINDYTESGFVWAPFDLTRPIYIMPEEACTRLETDLEIVHTDTIPWEGAAIDHNKEAHLALVKKGVETIQQSAMEKVVLSRPEILSYTPDTLLPTLKELLSTYNNALRYCWYHPKIGLWMGATPETLCRLEGQRLETMALAGTQLYQGTLDVHWEPKEVQEQQFVTDFIVDSLKPVLEGLKVSEAETARAGALVHLRTRISGRLNSQTSFKRIIDQLHPTPAVCGLPKAMAKTFILNEEPYDRQYYTGFLGYLNRAQKQQPRTSRRNIELRAFGVQKTVSHLFVNLRCMELTDTQTRIYVGGGITKDSIPEKEWEETLNKTRTMKNVLK